MIRRVLVIGILALVAAPTAHAAGFRVLYASDWTGSMQIFAADPSGRARLGQLTFAQPTEPCIGPTACGFTNPQPSPDGRWLVYRALTQCCQPGTLWLARADGTRAHAIGRVEAGVWTLDSRRYVYNAPDGFHVVTTGGRDSIVHQRPPGSGNCSPDTFAFIGNGGLTLLRGGRRRILVKTDILSFSCSRDGRRIAYATRDGVSLVSPANGRSHLLYPAPEGRFVYQADVAVSPDGRFVAFTLGQGIKLVDIRARRVRALAPYGHGLAWAPDSSRLLYVESTLSTNSDALSVGDIKTVTPVGHVRTVISSSKSYGGQLIAAAWTRSPRGLSYRRPQQVDGVFAGGPVQELVTDGNRVAFIACGAISSWAITTNILTMIARPPDYCRSINSRGHSYSLGLAGDRVAWAEKGWGLCFRWDAYEATIGESPITLAGGSGCLGGTPTDGVGTHVGAGDLLVRSRWHMTSGANGRAVSEQSIERIEPKGCPCPVVSSSPGPYAPLDVDAGRIVVSGMNETRILDANGTVLLSLPVPTLAAQLSGPDLVLSGSQLRVYDANTGAVRRTWPFQAAGHDCDFYGDPSCLGMPRLRLGDFERGLVAYTLDGQVHLLRVNDGADKIVARGTLPRFADSGLVFADGARVRLLPFDRLPLSTETSQMAIDASGSERPRRAR